MAVTVEELQILLSCDAAQAEAVLDEITKKVDSAVKKMQGKLDGAMDGGGTGGSKKQTSYYDALVKKISTAREKMNEALSGKQAGTEGADVNYNHWSQQADSLTKRLEKLRDTQKDVNETAAEMRDIPIQYPQQGKGGYQPWSRPVENWQASQERSRDAMRYIESDQRQASRVDTEKLAYGTPYEKLHEQFVRASEKVDELAAKLRQLQEEGGSPKAIDALESKLETASNKADRLAEKMAKIEDKSTGGNGAGEDIKQTGDAAQEATPKIESYNRALGKTSKAQGLFSRIGKASHKMFDKFGHSFKKHDGFLSQFGKTLKRVIMRMLAMALIRGTLRAISEGMTLLGKASNEAQKQLNRFKAMGNSVKTAFGSAALSALTVLAPVLYRIASAAIYAANALARFFAILGGGSYFAVNMTDSFDDIGEAAGGAGGAVKGLLADFDELNVIGQQGGGGGGGGLGDTIVSEEDPGSLADLLGSWLDPIEAAWENKGKGVLEAMSTALENIKGLSKTVKQTLGEVWQNGTGQETVEHILGIFQGMVETVGNLAHALDLAWQKNDNGLRIVQNIWNLFNDILGFGEQLWKDTADFFGDLDLSELLSSIADLTGYLERLVSVILPPIESLYRDVLLPIAKWAIEDAAPASIKVLAQAFNLLATILDPALKLIGSLLKILGPIIGALEYAVSALLKPVADGLGKLASALGLVNDKAGKSSEALNAIATVLSIVATTIAKLIEIAVTALAEAIEFLWTVVSSYVELIINVFSGLIEFLIGVFTGDWERALEGIKQVFESIWGFMKQVAFGFVNALIDVINKIGSIAAPLLGKTWEDIKHVGEASEETFNELGSAAGKAADKISKIGKAVKDIPSNKTSNIKINVTASSSGAGGGSGSGTVAKPTVNVNMAMASGGLAYGETLARIGEYPGARSNPEVVAPLDKLQSILERSGGSNGKDIREQNALLREQNRLLQIIAQKKLEVTPSPELGQVVTRAQALYGEV